MNYEIEISSRLAREAADASMVGRMRLVLSIAAVLTIFIDPEGVDDVTGLTQLVFCGYTLHSIVLYVLSQLDQPFLHSKMIHWLDVGWYALIVFFTGGSNSFFFLFFFFAILTSSFRWGFEEGARITLASSALFAVTGLVSMTEAEISRLLLRTTFLLALGYMIAYWGGSEVAQKRRLALLRDVSQLSNPRFGVDHTIASVLEKTRAFFKASSCILVMRDIESATWSLRTAMEDHAGRSINAERISAEAASPLMAFPQEQIVVYNRPLWPALPRTGGSRTLGNAQVRWIKRVGEPGESLAELLEARSFITAPLSLRKGEGRIYVVSSKHGFSKADALFLSHITAQAFPVIENIELLDRLASGAAVRERRKIARDLHDTTIQPYIGLKHGLSAVRNKAAADNPLIEDLDKLTAMATQVVGELRRYAGTFKNGLGLSEPVFLVALRRQAAHVREFYGIDIAVSMEGELDMCDRLAAEVFQVVSEGMSNIRKHTSARRGFVKLKCANGWLNIQIENECLGAQATEFMPRSIAERAAALGGKAYVEQGSSGGTAVHIEIPV
ncbi:sensor histidine kinase [Undibacterium arcticum]|uniref:Sensor histidine kinase n=1 Tax=Undibacterium arcticum TaxID=1762892 RepID=A0ABV7F0L8_9BURK